MSNSGLASMGNQGFMDQGPPLGCDSGGQERFEAGLDWCLRDRAGLGRKAHPPDGVAQGSLFGVQLPQLGVLLPQQLGFVHPNTIKVRENLEQCRKARGDRGADFADFTAGRELWFKMTASQAKISPSAEFPHVFIVIMISDSFADLSEKKGKTLPLFVAANKVMTVNLGTIDAESKPFHRK